MRLFTTKMGITIGLTSLSACVLLVAVFIGMIPDRRDAVLDGRRKLCEAIAFDSSILAGRRDMSRLRSVLQAVVERDEDVLSAGIRRPAGNLEIEIGPHQAHWQGMTTDRSMEEQIQVPLHIGETMWGIVEFRFQPLGRLGWYGALTSPFVLLVTFCSAGSFVAFMIFLGKMWQHLDPSQAVPGRVHSALDTLAAGLLVIDKDEQIVLANQAFADWVGQDSWKLLGREISQLPWVHDADASPQDVPWRRSVCEGSQLAGVTMGLKTGHDNDVRSLLVHATPVLGEDDDYRGVVISLDDVTQLETTRQGQHISNAATEDANRAQSDFLARMSHAIRTPMNAILGHTDALRQGYGATTSDRQDYLDTIHASGEHLLALSNGILDLSNIEAGHFELDLQAVAPYELLTQAVSAFRAMSQQQGLQLDFECDGPIPATIRTDPARLRQAIMNLIGNAIKFTEQGGVRLVSRLTSRHGKPQLSIDVVDTGIGVSAAAIEDVFNPFSQADSTIKRRFGGTGLGLAISRQLAEAMGGGITVTSTPGQGSTFTVTVDTGSLDGISLLSEDAARRASEQLAEYPRPVRTLSPGLALAADDGEANRKLLEPVLGRAGMTKGSLKNPPQGAVTHGSRGPRIPVVGDVMSASLQSKQRTRIEEVVGEFLQAMQVSLGKEDFPRLATLASLLHEAASVFGLHDHIIGTTLLEVAAKRRQAEDCRSILGQLARCRTRGDSAADVADEVEDEVEATRSEAIGAEAIGAEAIGAEAIGAEAIIVAADDVAADDAEADDAEAIGTEVEAESDAEPVAQTQSVECSRSETVVAATAGSVPVRSTLPLEDPEFLEIVIEFVEKLYVKLEVMQSAFDAGQWAELDRYAHWLKGSGGTAGFHEFTMPSRELESFVQACDIGGTKRILANLRDITSRIELPELKQAAFHNVGL